MKNIKYLKKYLVAVSAVCALACITTGGVQLVHAEESESTSETASEQVFAMEQGGSVRFSDPTGLRFRLKMDSTVKAGLNESDKVGMFIFPLDYLPKNEAGEYLEAEYSTAVTKKLDYDLTDALYESNGYWYGNGVIANILSDNISRNFIGIGYIFRYDTQKYEYADFTVENNARSVAYVAEKAYVDYESDLDSANAEKRSSLAGFLTEKYPDLDATYGGFGTEEYPYVISTETQFQYFAGKVTGGENYAGKYFSLAENLENVTYKVGKSDRAFSGIFDGNGKTITVNIASTANETHIALFPLNYGEIKNLTVKGTVTGNTGTSNANVGGIAGVNSGIISGCVNYASVSGYYLVGGIAGRSAKATGYDAPVIKNCSNYGVISTTAPEEICKNASNGGSGIGGIVGVHGGSGCLISNCTNYGAVTGGGGVKNQSSLYIGVGGIAGACNGTIESSINDAVVTGYYNVGAIAGYKGNSALVDGSEGENSRTVICSLDT